MRNIIALAIALVMVGITGIGCDDGVLDPVDSSKLVMKMSGVTDVLYKPIGESAEVQAVYLSITKAEIKPKDEMWRSLNVLTDDVDLVELADKGLTKLLIDEDLDAGWYDQIRLYFSDSKIVVDGDTLDLFVPSGLQTGYKIVDGFEIVDGMLSLEIDFSVEQSVVRTGSDTYILQPTTRVRIVTD